MSWIYHKNENQAENFINNNKLRYSNLETSLEDVVVLQNSKIKALKSYIEDLESKYLAMAEDCDDYKVALDEKEDEIKDLEDKINELEKDTETS